MEPGRPGFESWAPLLSNHVDTGKLFNLLVNFQIWIEEGNKIYRRGLLLELNDIEPWEILRATMQL